MKAETKCICCEHPILAASPDGLRAAMQDHAEYVNATADRAADPHFEDDRLTHLVIA
jgi:hypothetical protein